MASQHLAQRLGLPFAAIELTTAGGDERRAAFPLRDDTTPLGTLLVPTTLAEPALRRLRDRVIPSLEELLHAAREREVIADALQVSRDELAASRARVVAAADESRRRIERDLHDGVQQRLVSLGLEIRAAEAMVPAELEMARAQLSQTARDLAEVLEDVQKVSRGLHPPILSTSGLGPALRALARRSTLPVEVNVCLDQRLAERVEMAVYYIVSEALTNAAKHARASIVYVDLKNEDAILRLCVRDDGAGGADPDRGSGLIGLKERVEVLGGTIEIASPPGSGTTLLVKIPIEGG
jgi:signal transduction histidine kinase